MCTRIVELIYNAEIIEYLFVFWFGCRVPVQFLFVQRLCSKPWTYKSKFILSVFVQRLRSKPWTYKSKFIHSFFLFFFHSVSDFLGFRLVKALVSGSGSGIPLIQHIVTRNAGAWLSHATFRFLAAMSISRSNVVTQSLCSFVRLLVC